MFQRITLAFKAMIEAILGDDEEQAARTVSKANEILSRSTPDGALSILERMEQKMDEKEQRTGKILVAKAITEVGTTHDQEVHPEPQVDPKNIQERLLVITVLTGIAVIAIMGLALPWF
jgi:hypothetical protein